MLCNMLFNIILSFKCNCWKPSNLNKNLIRLMRNSYFLHYSERAGVQKRYFQHFFVASRPCYPRTGLWEGRHPQKKAEAPKNFFAQGIVHAAILLQCYCKIVAMQLSEHQKGCLRGCASLSILKCKKNVALLHPSGSHETTFNGIMLSPEQNRRSFSSTSLSMKS